MDFLGKNFLFSEQLTVKHEDFRAIELIGLYFSASWCGPCRYFTPMLKDFYENLNRNKKFFEVIFVSKDYTDREFAGYFSTMPWLAVPFVEKSRISQLFLRFRVRGIPTLIILDRKGNVLSRNGVTEIETLGLLAAVPWLKPEKSG